MQKRPTLTLKLKPNGKDIAARAMDSVIKPHQQTQEPETNKTPAAKVPSTENTKPLRHKPKMTIEDYKEKLLLFQKKYPKCFTNPPSPLAIDIHKELLESFKDDLSKTKIKYILGRYTRSKPYLRSLKLGAKRLNLDGSTHSFVNEEHAVKLENIKMNTNAPHDALVKKVMENPITASEFLDEYLPDYFKELIDLSTIKVEKESYVDESLKKKLSDIVYSFTTNDNKQAFAYCLLEHQSQPDHWISLRLWQYTLLLIDRHKTEKNKIPIVFPLILYNGSKKYSAPRNIWQLFDNPELAKKALNDDNSVIDLQSMSNDDINYEKHLSFVLYCMKNIYQRDTLKMLNDAFKRCKKAVLIDKEKDYIYTKLLLWYTDSKVPVEKKQELEQLIVDNLPKNDSEDIMRTIAQAYIEEGEQIGVLKGKLEGEQIGIQKGKLEIAKKMLAKGSDLAFVAMVTGLDKDFINDNL